MKTWSGTLQLLPHNHSVRLLGALERPMGLDLIKRNGETIRINVSFCRACGSALRLPRASQVAIRFRG